MWRSQIIMKNLKILLLSLILACATTSGEYLKIKIDLNLQNFKKHLEMEGRNVSLDFVFFPKEGNPKTFSSKKKLSKDEFKFIEENLKNLEWDKIKERYATKDAIMQHLPPVLISIKYYDKNKNIIILGDIPKELSFILKILEPYLQIDYIMLK